jgi:hypothetical protein
VLFNRCAAAAQVPARLAPTQSHCSRRRWQGPDKFWPRITSPIGMRPAVTPKTTTDLAFRLVIHLVEPPAGIEPATPSLPWNYREPLCGTASPQVTRDRRCQSYAFSRRDVLRSPNSLWTAADAQATPRCRTPDPGAAQSVECTSSSGGGRVVLARCSCSATVGAQHTRAVGSDG